MKIRAEQLPSYLQPLAQCYWIAGDEPLTRQRCLDRIKQTAKQQGMTRFVFHVQQPFDWSAVTNTLNTYSLFADKQLIELKLYQPTIDKNGQKALTEFVTTNNSKSILVITSERLSPQTMQHQWFKTMEQNSLLVQVWPLSNNQQVQWINNQLQNQGLWTDANIIQWWVEQTEGNLLAAQQVIEKLKLILPEGGYVDYQTIAEACASDSRYDVFALTSALLDADCEQSLKILTSLQHKGFEPSLVLWAVARELRMLYAIMVQIKQNQAIDAVLKQFKIFKQRQPKIKNAIKRLSLEQLQTSLSIAARIDQTIKGQKAGNSWVQLTDLIHRFTS
jgi:DNA polymerase-3 subunit delta